MTNVINIYDRDVKTMEREMEKERSGNGGGKREREREREGEGERERESCLLYTSPSPRDISLSRMPSSA